MHAKDDLETTLRELIEWKKGPGTVPEAAIENHLLRKVFRERLEYGDTRALRDQADGHRHKIDILLKPDNSMHMIVEVKQFGRINPKALQQAARYVRNMGAEYGIVTDGLIWIYFALRPHGAKHRIHRLVQFDTRSDMKLAIRCLERLRPNTIKRFLRAIAAVQIGISEVQLLRLLDMSLADRVALLAQRAEQTNVAIAVEDRAILRDLYSFTRGTLPTVGIHQLLIPIPLP